MKRSRRIAWWGAYGLGAAAVLAGLGWTTSRVLRLEAEEHKARIRGEEQEAMRLALWRLDSWLAPRIARESARPWFEYESYYPQRIAYDRRFEPIAEGEVLLPSPLLTFSSPLLPLHFQWRSKAGFTSPQVPPEQVLAEGVIACGPIPVDPDRRAQLASRTKDIDAALLDARLDAAEKALATAIVGNEEWIARNTGAAAGTSSRDDASDWRGRQTFNHLSQQQLDAPLDKRAYADLVESGAAETGPLVAMWLDAVSGGDPNDLVLVRRVRLDGESVVQGAFVDWIVLQRELAAQVRDIAESVRFRPAPGDAASDGARLASIPVVVELDAPVAVDRTPFAAPATTGLLIVWLASLGALGATGLALRASIANADRAGRFAASVTHELRTPLTTLRLYSDMLAEDMIEDPDLRRSYLETLRAEAARLGVLVENVLEWSRVEAGRVPADPRPTQIGALLERIEPVLRRRCDEAGASFDVRFDDDRSTMVATDLERIGHVVFNLVDNACKYAGARPTVRLVGRVLQREVELAVEDDGPGIAERLRGRVFRAFDRGERGPGDPVRGLGLGLAIAADVARGLGGRLRCERAASGGARIVLTLPRIGFGRG
jgi:signal transduction histidine kinase